MAAAQPWRRQPRYERLVSGERISAEATGRTCAHPDCETRLSRYNPDGTCSRHGGWTDDSVPHRGRKPTSRPEPQVARDEIAQPGEGPPITVRAELFLEPGAVTGRSELVAELRDVLQGTRARVESRDGSVLISGRAPDVLGAIERVHRTIAPRTRRLITDIRLEAGAVRDSEQVTQAS